MSALWTTSEPYREHPRWHGQDADEARIEAHYRSHARPESCDTCRDGRALFGDLR